MDLTYSYLRLSESQDGTLTQNICSCTLNTPASLANWNVTVALDRQGYDKFQMFFYLCNWNSNKIMADLFQLKVGSVH